jgi:hypothetical protein
MIFSNPEILRTNEDLKIGGVKVSEEKLSYNQYKVAVRIRLTKLVSDFIREDMADGATRDESVSDCLNLVYENLNYIGEKLYPDTVEGIVEEIMRTEEFQNWMTDIRYRFMATHKGVVDANTPVQAVGHFHPGIEEEIVQVVEEEDNLELFISGLVTENYLD